MKEENCKFSKKQEKLIEAIDKRQRTTRLWLFKAGVVATWVFLTWLVVQAYIFVIEPYKVGCYNQVTVVGSLVMIVIVFYSCLLMYCWFIPNKIYDIPSTWLD